MKNFAKSKINPDLKYVYSENNALSIVFQSNELLLGVLERLKNQGNTVVVIEHNLDVIKTADWIIDLGPEGGSDGGEIVAEGTPEDVAKVKKSFTGKFLKDVLS